MAQFTCTHCATVFNRAPSANHKSVNVFCSNRCSVIYNNIHRTTKRTKPNIKCTNPSCINMILAGKKFCSSQCKSDVQFLKYVSEFEATGFYYPTTKFDTSCARLKKYLKLKYGNKCSICGLTDWQGKPLCLILDHIDGVSNNWATSNIRLVCPNCDSQLPTFKGRNKGNGREYRRKQQEP